MDQTAQTDQVFNKFHKRKLFFSDLGGQLAIQSLNLYCQHFCFSLSQKFEK